MYAISYLLFGFILFIIANVSAENEDDMMPCLELFNPESVDKMCCASLESQNSLNDIGLDECITKDSEDFMCDDFQCILKKLGMFKDNKIDEDGANKFYNKIESDFPKEKSMVERVRRMCLDSKYESYPPEDACPAVKFYICTYINTYLGCENWKNEDVCTKMADNAKKCKAVLEDN